MNDETRQALRRCLKTESDSAEVHAYLCVLPSYCDLNIQKKLTVPSTVSDTQLNSAFYPSGVGKSSTSLPGWGPGGARAAMSGSG